MDMGLGQMAGMAGAAGAGGALSGLFGGGGWMGKKGRMQQFQRFNPQQQNALQQLLSMGMQNQDFGQIEQHALKGFNEQTIPGLAERFTSMGGGQRSSAFQGALGSASSDLWSQLGALRAQHGMNQTQMGLTPQFENMYMPRKAGAFESGLSSMSSIMSLLPMLAFL